MQIYLGQNEKWEREKNTKKNKGWKKDFQNAKKKSQTCALMQKKESDADDAPSQTASPITSVSTAVHINCLVCQEKKKEKKKKKRVKGPWDPQPHTQWLQQATWSKRRNTGHTLLMPALSGRQQGCGAGGCGWWRRCEVVHLFLHPPKQLSVELTWEMGFHQGQGEGRSGEVFERHPLQGFGKLLHKTAPAQWGATV